MSTAAETNPPLPVIGVGAIVMDANERVLLIQRGQKPAQGLWSVPGGKQEAGETLAEACCREVLEETGITIRLGPIIAVVERIAEGFHYVIIDFAAQIKDAGESSIPRHGGDVSAARWVGFDELDTYSLVSGLKPVIDNTRLYFLSNGPGGLANRAGSEFDYLAGFPNQQPRLTAGI